MHVLVVAIAMAGALGGPGAGESVEHIPLRVKPSAVVVDSLAGRIALVGVPDSVVEKAAKQSSICTKADRRAEGARLELACASRRLQVEVLSTGLRIRSMSTAPLTSDASRIPAIFYDPVVYGLGGACPGDTTSSRGECAYAEGKLVQAAIELRTAFNDISGAEGGGHAHAALRLGDLAWQAGDVESAANWYDKAGAGPFARIAASRLCELTPGCVDGPTSRLHFDAWDTGALPSAMVDEIVLRRARALAFAGRLDDATKHLLKNLPSCAAAPALCRAVAAEALWSRVGRDAPEALALAVSVPAPFEGEGALNLARAVVATTTRLGASMYAAGVLAAVSGVVPSAELPGHLRQTATLFVDGGDEVRADVVIGFAKSRGYTKGKGWAEILKRFAALKAGEPVPMHETKPAVAQAKPATATTPEQTAQAESSTAERRHVRVPHGSTG